MYMTIAKMLPAMMIVVMMVMMMVKKEVRKHHPQVGHMQIISRNQCKNNKTTQ